MRRIGLAKSLSSKLSILVFGLFAGSSTLLGLATYLVTHGWLEEMAIANLEALTSSRQTALRVLIDNKLARLDALARFHLPHYVQRVVASESEPQKELIQAIEQRIQRELASSDVVEGIALFDPDGEMIVREGVLSARVLRYRESDAFAKARIRSVVTEPIMHEGRFLLDLMAPVRNKQGKLLAVLLIQFDARNILALTGDYTGLGDTGETVLGIRKDRLVYFLTPLRFDPGMSKIKPADVMGERAIPMLHATSGQAGLTRALNYRDVEVLAAYRPVAPMGWGLVVKQDVSEAFSTVNHLQVLLIFLWFGLIVVSLAVTVPLARTFTRPIRELEQATENVADGDLTTKVPERRDDEVGRLASSFNRMVDQLASARQEQERSNRELTSFAYVVSHDLRAPLRAIFSLSQWLEEDLSGQLREEQKKQLVMLRSRAVKMDVLIKGLLEYSRVGRTDKTTALVDTNRLVKQLTKSMAIPDRFTIDIGQLPRVDANELRISQVFQNLIENAIKHHPGPKGTISISCEENHDWYTFCVKDDGDGIASQHHERIFTIFQTLGAQDESNNTGVGLALVKRIVEEQGGRTWVLSRGAPGEGAEFKFSWPKINTEE